MYHNELRDYIARANLICLDEVTYAVNEKGFKAIVPILTELKRYIVLIELTC